MKRETLQKRIVTVYQNNLPNAYTGRIAVKSGGTTLWSFNTGIVRTTKKDVKDDLIKCAANLKERHCL